MGHTPLEARQLMQKQCQQLLEDVLRWGLFPTKVKTTHWRAVVPDPSMALSEGRGGLKPSSTEAASANYTIPAAGRLLSIICKKKPQSQSHRSPQKSSTTTLPSKAPAHLLHTDRTLQPSSLVAPKLPKTENYHCTCEKSPALSSSSLWPSSAQILIQFLRLPTQHLQGQRYGHALPHRCHTFLCS